MPNPARQRGRQVNAFQALALLLTFALVAGVGGVLAAGLVLPGVAVANGVTDLTVTAFDDLPTELQEKPLPEKSVIRAADGQLLATFYDQNRVVVPLSEISPLLQQAVIATEDKRFYTHAGVDPTGMLRALVKNQMETDGGQEGASTLTQQYVKNVLIDAALAKDTEAERLEAIRAAQEAEGAEGYARKLREAKLAIALEKRETKEQILEKYLNIAPFGASVYGAESAAQYYFSKPAKDLNYLEAATIAGVTQSPTKWDPVLYPDASQSRRNIVLQLMRDQGYITAEEYAAGVATPLVDTMHTQPLKQGCMTAGDAVPGSGYFCDYVTKVILNDEAFGADRAARKGLLYRGGLTITTTLDPRQQAAADAEVKAGVPVGDPSGVKSAISVVEPHTGKITAMAQTTNFNPTSNPGPGEDAVNYNTDAAYGASKGFAPGSTFKPFTLAQWLKEGHSLNESINGTPMQYPMSAFNASCTRLAGPPYKFGNAEGKGAVMSVLDATKNSVNSGYIAMATKIDLCGMIDTATSLGIHQANTGEPFKVLPANVLGSDGVAPLTMAAAFAAFAADGMFCKPIAIVSVVDTNGASLPVPQAGCTQALEPQIARAMNFAMSNVWKGTAESVGAPPFPSAGKTGTTSENEYTWFVGYTPRLAAAVWVGHSEGMIPVKDVWIGGKFVRRAFGSSVAAPTWKRFMTTALSDGGANPDFAAPAEKEVFGEKVAVPSVVGLSEGDARNRLGGAGFRTSVAPEQVGSSLPAGTVAAQSPSGTAVKGSWVTLTLSNGQPAAPPPAPEQPGLPGGPGANRPGPGNPPGQNR
ncbi:transglycosylase domain-containing protein [Cellulomonas fengjieae]|uniref:Penicillin-binding protein n=1 Tax=Cellulomonas fengjieae TaxID=2819978 RepID=A0ABS3SCB4_9CELL|nr:transglycosylase domain-containing protein [Cellulomonas fengjieae]MBO3083144.1 penicillin-binding protein [Cellulomonas fengjieae]MBO3102109.1 penicillin-binding protein [Cellulomonas fengjieae]QVI65493.1 penicillin-binding protein [Cellulomonas fengjieae]